MIYIQKLASSISNSEYIKGCKVSMKSKSIKRIFKLKLLSSLLFCILLANSLSMFLINFQRVQTLNEGHVTTEYSYKRIERLTSISVALNHLQLLYNGLSEDESPILRNRINYYGEIIQRKMKEISETEKDILNSVSHKIIHDIEQELGNLRVNILKEGGNLRDSSEITQKEYSINTVMNLIIGQMSIFSDLIQNENYIKRNFTQEQLYKFHKSKYFVVNNTLQEIRKYSYKLCDEIFDAILQKIDTKRLILFVLSIGSLVILVIIIVIFSIFVSREENKVKKVFRIFFTFKKSMITEILFENEEFAKNIDKSYQEFLNYYETIDFKQNFDMQETESEFINNEDENLLEELKENDEDPNRFKSPTLDIMGKRSNFEQEVENFDLEMDVTEESVPLSKNIHEQNSAINKKNSAKLAKKVDFLAHKILLLQILLVGLFCLVNESIFLFLIKNNEEKTDVALNLFPHILHRREQLNLLQLIIFRNIDREEEDESFTFREDKQNYFKTQANIYRKLPAIYKYFHNYYDLYLLSDSAEFCKVFLTGHTHYPIDVLDRFLKAKCGMNGVMQYGLYIGTHILLKYYNDLYDSKEILVSQDPNNLPTRRQLIDHFINISDTHNILAEIGFGIENYEFLNYFDEYIEWIQIQTRIQFLVTQIILLFSLLFLNLLYFVRFEIKLAKVKRLIGLIPSKYMIVHLQSMKKLVNLFQ